MPKIDQSGPPKTGEFTYIDISSIDNDLKRVVEPKRLPVGAAPSRAKQRLQPGDVLVSMTRPNLNAVAIVSPDLKGAIGSTGFHVLRPVEGIEPRWLFYGVQTHTFVEAMSSLVQGALYPAVRPKDIKGFGLDAPSWSEQQRIVAEIEKQFSRLDEAVANLKRVKANLKRYKAAVLKTAVNGRLVRTEAELARQDGHDYESGVELLARLLKERAGTWSGRGKYREPVPPQQNARQIVPEGWAVSSLEQLTAPDRPCGYGVLQPGEDVSSGVPFVRVGDIADGRGCLESLKKISPSIAARYPRTQLEGGEVLITLVGAIGRTAIVPQSLNGANVARAVAVIPIAQDMNARWVELWLRSPDSATELNQAAHEVARKTLNLEDVRRMNIAIPPLSEQRRIIEAAERALSVAIKQENAIEITMRRVERLRAAVLSVAFNHSRPMR
ncbi:MAG: restriction endonuclease subunit S [Nitrospira sp.]|nr:restriction endonuclease subunit S [Nitrospira sp.]